MVTVKFIKEYTGTETDGAHMRPNDTLETIAERAAWLILAGYAKAYKPPKPEKVQDDNQRAMHPKRV